MKLDHGGAELPCILFLSFFLHVTLGLVRIGGGLSSCTDDSRLAAPSFVDHTLVV